MSNDRDHARDRAARAAVGEVRAGMIVGLGTGDTASRAVIALGELALDIQTVATSEHTAALARKVGLVVLAPDEVSAIDLTIDGADEIDPALRLIKGAGAALTRERLVARASRRLVIVADEGKLVSRLGERQRLPVEILPFGRRWTLARLAAQGLDPIVREGLTTDNGGLLVECALGAGMDLTELARTLDELPGVIDHGLFLDEAALAYLGRADAVERRAR